VPVEEHERADRRAGTLAPMGVPETRTREAGIPSLWLVSAGRRPINEGAIDFCRRYIKQLEKLVDTAESTLP
jgi:hypothetical protein